MRYADAGGVRIAYDDQGPHVDVAIVCLTGWWLDQGFFGALTERLAARYRVITLDWRGHGDSGQPPTDFGHQQLADDAIAVIEASGVRRVVPVAQAHGGWAAVELRRRLGERVERIVATSWLVFDPSAPFVDALEALQDAERWREAREQLFSMWLTGAPDGVVEEVRREMEAHDFDMCSRAARAIAADYARYGNPLRAIAEIDPMPDVLHLFSQPRDPEFLAAQEKFSDANPWFSVKRLDGVSHFPPLELPDETADEINRFIGRGREQPRSQ
jgi:pimeloyl-ACP methyl ester carboxylesterase